MSEHLDIRQEFEEWIRTYVDRLTRLAYTYLHDWTLSEDTVQEAFLKAYQSRTQLRNPHDPFPWLARIVINQCRSRFRRTWREVVTGFLPDRKVPGAEDSIIAEEEANSVHQSIAALPESLRIPLYLYYFEDMSTKEIAKVIGASDGAVRTRLTRARERFAIEFKRREADEHRGQAVSRETTTDSPHRR